MTEITKQQQFEEDKEWKKRFSLVFYSLKPPLGN